MYESAEKIFLAEAEWETVPDELETEYTAHELEPLEQFESVAESDESGLDIVKRYLGGKDWQPEEISAPETYLRGNEVVYADGQSLTEEIFEGGDEAAIAKHEEMLEALRTSQPFVFDGILEGVYYGTVVRLDAEGQLQYENFSHQIEREVIHEEDLLESEDLAADFLVEQAAAASTEPLPVPAKPALEPPAIPIVETGSQNKPEVEIEKTEGETDTEDAEVECAAMETPPKQNHQPESVQPAKPEKLAPVIEKPAPSAPLTSPISRRTPEKVEPVQREIPSLEIAKPEKITVMVQQETSEHTKQIIEPAAKPPVEAKIKSQREIGPVERTAEAEIREPEKIEAQTSLEVDGQRPEPKESPVRKVVEIRAITETRNKPEIEVKETAEDETEHSAIEYVAAENLSKETHQPEMFIKLPKTEVVQVAKLEKSAPSGPDVPPAPITTSHTISEFASQLVVREKIKSQDEIIQPEIKERIQPIIKPAVEVATELQEIGESPRIEQPKVVLEKSPAQEVKEESSTERKIKIIEMTPASETRQAPAKREVVQREKSEIPIKELRKPVLVAEERITSVKRVEIKNKSTERLLEKEAHLNAAEHIQPKKRELVKLESVSEEYVSQSIQPEKRKVERPTEAERKKTEIILRLMGVPQRRFVNEINQQHSPNLFSLASASPLADDTEIKDELNGITLIHSRI